MKIILINTDQNNLHKVKNPQNHKIFRLLWKIDWYYKY